MEESNKLWEKVNALYKNGEYSSAFLKLNELIEKDSSQADFFEKRAMCNYHLGNIKECIPDFDKAQRLEPNNPFRYSSRAYVKGRIKDFDGAIADYEKAIHLDPKDAIAHNNLGLILEQKGYQGRAKTNFEKADNLAGITQNNYEQIAEDNVEEKSSVRKEVGNAVTTKKGFNEFIAFIMNGFKISK